MIGIIKHYDAETQSGTITNGKEIFNFDASVWIASAPPEIGDEVTFDLAGVKAFKVNLRGATLNTSAAVKYKYVALALALLLGWAGVHRIYLGYYRLAIIQIIATGLLIAAGLPGYVLLWSFVEAILIFGGQIDKDAANRPLK
ncbi:MAG: TM2 domain-containing protein [Methyloglobulus sp.]|nr:TM2 domain-containing protein [Methyloglobulus sp.]